MQDVKKFTTDVGWVLGSSLITLVIGTALRVVLARWLGPTELGLYSMVLTVQWIAVFFTTFGIPFALTKYIAEYKDAKDKLFQTTSAAFIGSLIMGLVVGILLYVLSGPLASLFHMPELARLLRILAFSLPLNSVLQTVLGLFTGLRQMKNYALISVFQYFLMTSLIVTFVWLGFGVDGAICGLILSVAGGFILGLYFSRKYFRINVHGLSQGIRRLALFGSQVFGADAIGLILTYTDTLMIGYFLSANEVGYYSIAISVISIVLILPGAISTITYPATSEYVSQNRQQSLAIMVDKSTKYTACVLLPLGLVIGFFSKELVTIVFGQEFGPAVMPMVVLIIGKVVLGSTVGSVGASISGAGRPDIVLKLAALAAVMNVVLNLILIPSFGILGAAIATTISTMTGAGVGLLFIWPRILKVRLDIKWFAKTFGLTCIAIALFLAGREFVNSYIAGSVILCAYMALIPTIFLTREDRDIFKSLVYSIVRRR